MVGRWGEFYGTIGTGGYGWYGEVTVMVGRWGEVYGTRGTGG